MLYFLLLKVKYYQVEMPGLLILSQTLRLKPHLIYLN